MHADIFYLTLEQILLVHKDQIEGYGGGRGIRDLALLESAVFRPQTMFNGNDLYPTLFDKAGTLIHSLIINRPFVDGNKRTGIVCMIIFLAINDITVNASEFELLSFAIDVAEKNIDLDKIAHWIKENIQKK